MERSTSRAESATSLGGGPQEGEVLGGRYRLGRLLGTGSFGRVYEGHHTSLAQRVAIKVFRKDFVALAGGPDRVLMDGRAASRVHHRNIVDVHDLGRLDETVYVATEFVLGRTLHALLLQTGRLSWSRARGVALQIAAALKAAHKRNVLHRGLRAANCFVLEVPASAEGEPRIKVSDFGFAHPGLASGGRGEEHTSPFVGDASYTAPELASNAAASVQSDVYALGVLLYRMLAGMLPFEGGTPYQVIAAHVSSPVPSLRERVRSIPAEVEAIVLRALAKDPSERFESMRELEVALEEVQAPDEDPRDEAAPEAALEEIATGQHLQVKALEAPAAPVRDEAMHAAFERRDEPDEVGTSMFDRRNLVPYFGPVDALEAPPEPTIMLGASMFAQAAAQAWPGGLALGQPVIGAGHGVSAFPQSMPGARPGPLPGARPEVSAFAQPAMVVEPKPMLGVPGASELPEVVQGAFPLLMPGVRPEASAFPQLMPGARSEASAHPSLEPVQPEATVMLGGGGYPLALPEPTVMLGAAGHPLAPPEATTMFSYPSASGASGAPLPPTARLDGAGTGAIPSMDEPTTHFRPQTISTATVPWAGHVASGPSPAPAVPVPVVMRSAPVIAPSPSAHATPIPAPPRLPMHPHPGASTPRSPMPYRPSEPASISAMSVVIVGVAIAIAASLVGLALACPARAASGGSAEPNASSPSTRDGVANPAHPARSPSSQDW